MMHAAMARLEPLFVSPRGVRPGWRLVLFVIAYLALGFASRPLRALLMPGAGADVTPGFLLRAKIVPLLTILGATLLAAKAEGRPLGAYGLRLDRAAPRRFLLGGAWGAALLTAMIALMALFRGIGFAASPLAASDVVRDGVGWALAYFVLAVQEEVVFRGYLQHTLAEGLGFWPAAAVTTLLFALAHVGNPGESVAGIGGVVAMGLLLCLFLRGTGSLWFPIGVHWAWDTFESYVYGVPNSGIMVRGHLLEAHLQGPAWLTGGTAGPEGSAFAFLIITLAAPVFITARRKSRSRFA